MLEDSPVIIHREKVKIYNPLNNEVLNQLNKNFLHSLVYPLPEPSLWVGKCSFPVETSISVELAPRDHDV
jgi:hypothetical protein